MIDIWIVIMWTIVSLIAIAIVFLKPQQNPIPVPEDATIIGDGYMHVWMTQSRVNMRFRNLPGVTVAFDKKVASEFGVWLEKADNPKEVK